MARVDLDWLRQLRFRWEAVNNAWNQWVLGYNPDRQREVLSKLGLEKIDWRGMTALLASFCGAALLVMTWWLLARRPRLDPAQRAWLAFCRRVARLGLTRQAWEGPADYARRIAAERPAIGEIAGIAADAYIQARYGTRTDMLAQLRAATKKLPRKWSIV